MDKFQPFWTIWTNFVKSEQTLTCLNQFGHVWTNLDKFKPILKSLNQFGHKSGPIWKTLIKFGLFGSFLNMFDLIESFLIKFRQANLQRPVPTGGQFWFLHGSLKINLSENDFIILVST